MPITLRAEPYCNHGRRTTRQAINSAAFCAVIFSSTAWLEAAVLVPTDLQNGDSYRLVFQTSVTTTATSNSISDYNSFVDNLAKSPSSVVKDMNTTWKVIGSTLTVDARDNTGTNDSAGDPSVPIYRVDGVRIANSNADLWDGAILAPIAVWETDFPYAGEYAWTGTASNGVRSSELGGSVTTTVGATFIHTFSGWINAGTFDTPEFNRRLYAMSGVLTVVPEPSTLLFSVLAIAAGLVVRRR